MKRLYFYSPSATGGKVFKNQLYVNTTPAYLTAYVKRQDPALLEHFAWTKIQLLEKTREQLIDELNHYEIDILCVSLYIWNSYQILDLIKDIKRHLKKNLTVIAGGPSVDPHRNKRYLNENSDIDFAIYAQGEQAFRDVMNHLIHGKKLNVLETKNAAWMDKGKMKTSHFTFLRQKEGSPYVEAQEVLRQIVTDPEYHDMIFFMPYETSKGCAYNCTFCDWTSGLTHKVSHRKFAWEQELELLGELGLVNFHLSDSNFGQHRQDIDIARTMARLKKEKGYKFYITDTNFSKLRKKESFEILKILLDAGIVHNPKFAVQDIHDFILENIERPDVPWNEHKVYIQEIRDLYPEFDCRIELIMGLPGQTRDTWEETLIAVDLGDLTIYPWFILPNSPAGYDQEYRQKMQLKTVEISLFGIKNEMVVGTYSYDFDDYAYFWLLRDLVKHSFTGAIKNRRLLFELVRSSRYLQSMVEDIKENFLTGKLEKIHAKIETFISQIMIEFPRRWEPADLKNYLGYRHKQIKLPNQQEETLEPC